MDAPALAALLVRCQAGDKAAWDALVEAYWPRLYGYALRATGNGERAQDLVQETFLRIVQRLERYDDQGKFEAWLFRILINLVRDQGRSLARRPTQSMTVGYGDDQSEMSDELAHDGPAPDEPLAHREDVDRMQAALQRLPEMDRQVLYLRHFADMPFKDIARTLNCPLGTVLARSHRALNKLRSLLEVSHDPS